MGQDAPVLAYDVSFEDEHHAKEKGTRQGRGLVEIGGADHELSQQTVNFPWEYRVSGIV